MLFLSQQFKSSTRNPLVVDVQRTIRFPRPIVTDCLKVLPSESEADILKVKLDLLGISWKDQYQDFPYMEKKFLYLGTCVNIDTAVEHVHVHTVCIRQATVLFCRCRNLLLVNNAINCCIIDVLQKRQGR